MAELAQKSLTRHIESPYGPNFNLNFNLASYAIMTNSLTSAVASDSSSTGLRLPDSRLSVIQNTTPLRWMSSIARSARNMIFAAKSWRAVSRTRRSRSAIGFDFQSLEMRCLPAGLPTLSISDIVVTEGDSGNQTAAMNVSLSEPSLSPVRFSFASRNQAAFAGSDYTTVRGTITIPAGQTNATINVPILGDRVYEADEAFEVVLSGPVQATIVDGVGRVLVQNNDPIPVVAISSATTIEGRAARLNLTLSNPSSTPITVRLAGVSETATSGLDFPALNKPFVIPAGYTSMVVNVLTTNDSLDEPNETFQVALSDAIGAVTESKGGIVTIEDNDLPTLSISDVEISENLPGTAVATINLSAPNNVPVTVRVASRDKTAVAGRDYARVSMTVTIPAGLTSQTVNLATIDDTIFDPNETFELVLSAPVNAILARSVATATVIEDESQPELSVQSKSIQESRTADLFVTLQISLNRATSKAVSFRYQTADGTATAGQDYLAATGLLTIPAGSTTTTVTLRIKRDTILEPSETIRIVLSNVTNAIANPLEGILTIDDLSAD